MDHTGAIDTEEELGPLAHLAPSPQSESVAHEFQELSLQSSQHLPTLNERKNGHNKKSKKPHLPLVLGSCRLHLEPARCLDG